MEYPLLATKLHSPSPPARLLRRLHLLQQLNNGWLTSRPLTLVSAPAGFGKSTCIAEWISSLSAPHAWLSLDAFDNDPVRFLVYFNAALQKIDARIGLEAAAALRSSQPPSPTAVFTALVNDIQNYNRPFVLVLDDFQVIKEKSLLAAFEVLLSNPPHNLHLVLITREDPQLPLSRLRANNRMTELRAADLRLSSVEVRNFLNEQLELDLSPADLETLERRTEGWIVGLQLAALSMRAQPDRSEWIRRLSGSQRFILSYLTDEVLERQPPEVQDFLLRTSILTTYTAELCNHVLARSDCASLLDRVLAANLFLIPLDEENNWFRYHHLFAELLQAVLRRDMPQEEVFTLHNRASEWYLRHHLMNEAINHAFAGKDEAGAAKIIENHAAGLLSSGELSNLRGWIQRIPPEIQRQHPLLLIASAWTLALTGAVSQVEPLLQEADKQSQSNPDTAQGRLLEGNLCAIRSFFAMMSGAYPQALQLAEKADGLLPESYVMPRALLPYTKGAAYRASGQYGLALQAFKQVARSGEALGDSLTWITGLTEVANVQRALGRLNEAAQTCLSALRQMHERGIEQFGSLAKIEVPLIEVLREQNRLLEAEIRINHVFQRLASWSMPSDTLFALLARIHLQQARRDLPGAWESIQRAKALKTEHPVLLALSWAVDMSEVRYFLDSAQPEDASHCLKNLAGTIDAIKIYLFTEQYQVMLARLALLNSQPEQANSLLSPLVQYPDTAARPGALIEMHILRALALHQMRQPQAALTSLADALRLAEPQGYMRLFLDESQDLKNLLSALYRQGFSSSGPDADRIKNYCGALLAAFRAEAGPSAAAQGESTSLPTHITEDLSEREVEVMRLIADGLKYEEIAQRLVVSINTVRTHVRSVYAKLGVNNRSTAVKVAQELRLL